MLHCMGEKAELTLGTIAWPFDWCRRQGRDILRTLTADSLDVVLVGCAA